MVLLEEESQKLTTQHVVRLSMDFPPLLSAPCILVRKHVV
jgi:hypothetical protein